ncbi:nuclear RNA export factor 1-like [Scaptodrosophila lebanonensis]|uniref:Nuclear RNA export factor 1-like n=1 Tax=Drosophila lebanonensis TaxID=7225 RepID=A0A6J2TGN0_DROLE|nr:nuclear RNA export factor 1-like [Scaptodrosophila lebanonensis]
MLKTNRGAKESSDKSTRRTSFTPPLDDGVLSGSLEKSRTRPAEFCCRNRWIKVSKFGWYRVLVRSNSYQTSQMLQELRRAVAPLSFMPYYLHRGGERDAPEDRHANFTFYVNSYTVACELLNCSGRWLLPNGKELFLRVNSRAPLVRLNADYRARMRIAIKRRFDPTNGVLNMCGFHTDSQWVHEFCSLSQYKILKAAIGIMGELRPEVSGLLLDSNYLKSLHPFRGVERELPRLSSISLKDNELSELHFLLVFKKLNLTHIKLQRNPWTVTDRQEFKRRLLEVLPQLTHLNDRPIRQTFRLGVDRCRLLKSKEFYMVNMSAFEDMRTYIYTYLTAFDSASRRSQLAPFYHEHAMVSVTVSDNMMPYKAYDHNILNECPHRRMLCKRYAILDMFADWPRTEHLRDENFTFDLTVQSEKMLCFSITGYFNDHGMELERRFINAVNLNRLNRFNHTTLTMTVV